MLEEITKRLAAIPFNILQNIGESSDQEDLETITGIIETSRLINYLNSFFSIPELIHIRSLFLVYLVF
jgi:hypothetical protein